MLIAMNHQSHYKGDKPHIHLYDSEDEMDLRSPFYSMKEYRDFLCSNKLFRVHHMLGFGKGVSI